MCLLTVAAPPIDFQEILDAFANHVAHAPEQPALALPGPILRLGPAAPGRPRDGHRSRAGFAFASRGVSRTARGDGVSRCATLRSTSRRSDASLGGASFWLISRCCVSLRTSRRAAMRAAGLVRVVQPALTGAGALQREWRQHSHSGRGADWAGRVLQSHSLTARMREAEDLVRLGWGPTETQVFLDLLEDDALRLARHLRSLRRVEQSLRLAAKSRHEQQNHA